MSSTEKLAVFTALGLEAKLVEQATKAKPDITPPVYVVGMGAGLAAEKVARAKKDGATAIIHFGFCGALDPDLVCGHVVVPKQLLANDTSLGVDENWQAGLAAHLAQDFMVTQNPIFTSKTVIKTAREKAQMFSHSGACAVDMESAVLAKQAEKQQMRFAVVRVVHDTAQMQIPNAFADVFDEQGNIAPWRLIKGLLFNWPGAKALKAQTSASQDASANLKGVVECLSPTFKLPK